MTDQSGFSDQIPQSLRDLYQDTLSRTIATPFRHNEDCSSPTNPFIPNADERYWNAKVKVMIFGQETRGWLTEPEYQFPKCKNAATIADLYSNGMKSESPKWAGTFRNGFKQIKELLDGHYNSPDDSVGYAWNNLIKIGKRTSGTPCKCIIDWQKDWFEITRQEVEDYYKPNFIIFLTGNGYDGFIKDTFRDVDLQSVEGYEKNEMVIVKSSSFKNATAIRTYHPGYLNRAKGRRQKYLNDLVDQLLKHQADQ